jgi:hypothetical protein
MKNLNKYLIILLTSVLFFSCKQSFLDLQPKAQLTTATTFNSYGGFQTYAWNFYNVFPAYDGSLLTSEINSDLFLYASPNSASDFIWQRITIPTTDNNYTGSYSNIRSINIMLDNIDSSPLSETEKKHWRSVGYFFRAYNYANLVNLYGDVPYITSELKDNDQESLFGPRTPRNEVAKNILSDLNYAAQNVKPAGDGANTINTNVVLAMISRFGLREGTWRKYQGLNEADIYLQASAEASKKLIAAFPTLNANYDDDFNSASLAGSPGIILYKLYTANQLTHGLSTMNRNSSGRYDLTKKAADMYLMTDGQNRFTSPLFAGDKNPYTEFRNRDKRLYYVVPPPYKVTIFGSSANWQATSNPADAEYFPLMASISSPDKKTLPSVNWNPFVLAQEPHYVDENNGQPFNVTYTGYRFYKFYNKMVNGAQSQDISDAPIFRMGEVLANYAEATYELGQFNQTIADQTINKLRDRGGVAHLNVAIIPDDPTRDPQINPVLWEIRRERSVELMGEGFRFHDLRRWKKMDYAVQIKLGRYITKGTDVSAKSIIPILNGANAGYISYEGQPPATFPEYYYLYPIPSNEIVLNPKLVQNPGWK